MERAIPNSSSKLASALALLLAVGLAVGLFLIIPLTQALESQPAEIVTYRQTSLSMPPPPQIPPEPEETRAQHETESPKPPEMEQAVEDVPVQQLQLSLAPGMGVALTMGVPAMPQVEQVDTVGEIEKIFNFDELAQTPSIINGDMIRMDYPRELARRGVREARVELEVLIDKTGRVTVERVVSMSYEHPRLAEAARRAAEQARFTITRVNGRAVAVRGRFPLTLQSPR